MSEGKYSKEIRTTGFILECKIGELLRRAGWHVISNKYYEDDFQGSVREMDLLAYKVKKVQQISVYTTLLLSCKKNESKMWAMLAKPIELGNPNSDLHPLHIWSNDTAVSYVMAKSGFAASYHHDIENLGVTGVLAIPEYEVFAFQEMDKKTGAAKNDTNIFTSITSLMKAQAYELGMLSQRKNTPVVYQFNLISVIDSELYRIVINGDDISEEALPSEHYISRYIINRQQTVSRIRFSTASGFESLLSEYGRLHDANCTWIDRTIDGFYSNMLKDDSRSREALI